ncbi:DUF433 domain-containing protein [Hymenobacter sp. BT18]|uniref:DUF433 domain-containing protein n=1 Tax=Hymenobacter sp. BT18 TaxID=2835648 RepID=UPI00143E2696|nr:DUF433 domain-containing protein [Hymenobacter sp. BT18]QIX62118.1 DUF433 domain-containing protein [Hymenobacter sp. BT18]
MQNLRQRLTINSRQCGGRPYIRVLDILSADLLSEPVLAKLPDLEPLDIQAALQYAANR